MNQSQVRGSVTPVVSIVIPIHNQLNFTRQSLASLEATTEPGIYEVIVVNDASSDGSEEFLSELAGTKSWLRFVSSPFNRGFAASCNLGAGMAQGTYILFLNNDALLSAGWLPPLLHCLESRPEIGIAAPKLVFPDGTIQHCGKVWGEWHSPRSNPDHVCFRAQGDALQVNRSRNYQMVTGACMLLRRAELLRCGPFDDRSENGWENDDLFYAYRKHGLHIHYCPDSKIFISLNKGLSTDERCFQELSERDADKEEQLALCQKVESYTQVDGLEGSFPPDSRPVPLISIIILTFNQLPYTIQCVESIRRHTPERYELIFVDNGSTDETVSWLRALADQDSSACKIIENGRNIGFSKGCNQGINASRGECILLLNNDVVVTEGWLQGMLECLQHDDQVGIVGPMTNNISGIQQVPESPYRSLSDIASFSDEFHNKYRYRRIFQRRIVGFCMLFRRELVEKIGLLDETFGTGNFEDDDYCLRSELEGYRNVIAGDVFIHHYGSVSFKGNQINYAQTIGANHKLFFEKWSRPVTDCLLAKKIIVLKVLEDADGLKRHGKSNEAIDLLLKTGIGQIPDEPRFYGAIAEILRDEGMTSDALDTLEQCHNIEKNPYVMVTTIYCLIESNRFHDARSRWSLLSGFKGFQAYIPLFEGLIATAESDVTAARSAFDAALVADPTMPDIYVAIGALAEHLQQNVQAFEMYAKATIMSAGSNPSAVRGVHRQAVLCNYNKRATEILESLRQFRRDDKAILFMLADLYIQAGNVKSALALAEEAMVMFGAEAGLVQAALSLRNQIGPLVVPPAKKKEGIAVSLCMIVKDEAKNISRCLASLKPVVDEVVVVDTGSSDLTREIAEAFGARVVEYNWSGDFSAARNKSLETASGNWILVMDADEVISTLDHEAFNKLIKESKKRNIAYTVVTRNYNNQVYIEQWQINNGQYPGDEAGRGWIPSDKVRVFPNIPLIRFENEIHEMVEPVLNRLKFPRKKTSSFLVHHYGHLDDARQTRKKEIYYELSKKKLETSGGSPTALVELAIQANEANRSEEALDLWQRALKYDPHSWLVYFNLGATYIRLGRIEDALRASKKAIELKNDYREAIANLGYCLALLGRPGEALTVLLPASNRYNDYPILNLMLAVAYCCNGDYQEGERCFAALVAANVVCDEFLIKTLAVLEGLGGKEMEITALRTCANRSGIVCFTFG